MSRWISNLTMGENLMKNLFLSFKAWIHGYHETELLEIQEIIANREAQSHMTIFRK